MHHRSSASGRHDAGAQAVGGTSFRATLHLAINRVSRASIVRSFTKSSTLRLPSLAMMSLAISSMRRCNPAIILWCGTPGFGFRGCVAVAMRSSKVSIIDISPRLSLGCGQHTGRWRSPSAYRLLVSHAGGTRWSIACRYRYPMQTSVSPIPYTKLRSVYPYAGRASHIPSWTKHTGHTLWRQAYGSTSCRVWSWSTPRAALVIQRCQVLHISQFHIRLARRLVTVAHGAIVDDGALAARLAHWRLPSRGGAAVLAPERCREWQAILVIAIVGCALRHGCAPSSPDVVSGTSPSGSRHHRACRAAHR